MNMTIEEVGKKIIKLLKEGDISKDLLVTEAYVIREGDYETVMHGFVPGTVVFECKDTVKKDIYKIWVTPDSITELLN